MQLKSWVLDNRDSNYHSFIIRKNNIPGGTKTADTAAKTCADTDTWRGGKTAAHNETRCWACRILAAKIVWYTFFKLVNI